MTQILWEAATAVLRGQVTGIQSYLKKQEKFQTFSNLYKFQNFTSLHKAPILVKKHTENSLTDVHTTSQI